MRQTTHRVVISTTPLISNRGGKERAFVEGGLDWNKLIYAESQASAMPCQIAFSSYEEAVKWGEEEEEEDLAS